MLVATFTQPKQDRLTLDTRSSSVLWWSHGFPNIFFDLATLDFAVCLWLQRPAPVVRFLLERKGVVSRAPRLLVLYVFAAVAAREQLRHKCVMKKHGLGKKLTGNVSTAVCSRLRGSSFDPQPPAGYQTNATLVLVLTTTTGIPFFLARLHSYETGLSVAKLGVCVSGLGHVPYLTGQARVVPFV